jgi:hypothetical protein
MLIRMKWFLSVAAIVAAIIFGPLITDAIRAPDDDPMAEVDALIDRSREQRERVEGLLP